MIEANHPSMSRGTAARLVAVIALVTLALNLWQLRADLPAVLHSDYQQVEQAVDLVSTGSVEDWAIYPLPLVYAYAAADLAAYAVGRVLGWDGYADWPTFVQHLAQPQVHHAIGRALGAVCAALFALGTYRLARVRFDRRVAVLAAAAASFSPLLTIYAHQVRPHVPVIALVVLVAPAVLRAALDPSLRTGLFSGLGTGLTSAVFQVGLPYAASGFALVVLFARPVRRLGAALLGMAGGFVVGWIGLFWLSSRTGLITEGSRESGLLMRGAQGNLGFGLQDGLLNMGRFLRLGPYWLAAETVCALGFLGFIGLCLARRRSWRDVVLHGLPACAILMGICLVIQSRPRYTMYATPLLAPLAASACLAIPSAIARRVAVGLLVLVPLASSIRSDLLRGRSDTRMALHASLPALAESGMRVVVQADILPSQVATQRGVWLFPPGGDYRIWMQKTETPRQTLARLQPEVFVRRRDSKGLQTVADGDLQVMGLVVAKQLGADAAFVYDDPEWVLPELWRADRPGPAIDFLARKELVERVRALPTR